MTRNPKKSDGNTICFRIVVALAALFFVLQCPTVLAAPQGQPGASVFNSTCASCHGRNGTPTAVGKSLNAPDLGSTAVQSHTDADLHQIIANGKGNMPPFKNSLSDAQIDALIAYIRTFSGQHK
ncbi:MAG: cytochrome c [Terriglobales bacterium]|jgi:cytochrome c6